MSESQSIWWFSFSWTVSDLWSSVYLHIKHSFFCTIPGIWRLLLCFVNVCIILGQFSLIIWVTVLFISSAKSTLVFVNLHFNGYWWIFFWFAMMRIQIFFQVSSALSNAWIFINNLFLVCLLISPCIVFCFVSFPSFFHFYISCCPLW